MRSHLRLSQAMISHNMKILFQGDSITDAGRNRGPEGPNDSLGKDLGKGYAMIAAAELLSQNPSLQIHNLGISGNRITDLYARAKEHIWNLEPDLLSILIGVNDTWHEFSRKAGVDVPRYARLYRTLLEETRERLPKIRFVLCEPFVLGCGVVTEAWRKEVDQRRQVVAKLAKDFDAVLVPFQDLFDQAIKEAPPEHWAGDGVHPSAAGHHRMARMWLERVRSST